MTIYKANQRYITRTDYTGPHEIVTTGNVGRNVTIKIDSKSSVVLKMTSEQKEVAKEEE